MAKQVSIFDIEAKDGEQVSVFDIEEPTPAPSFTLPDQALDVETIVDNSDKNWDISQSLEMHPSVTERWLNILGTPTTLGVPLPPPIKPKDPVDQPEGEPTFSGQLIGGTIEMAKHLADLPRRTLMLIGQMEHRPFMGTEVIPGATPEEIRTDPLYRAAAVVSERASVGTDFLLNTHPEWKANPPDSFKDLTSPRKIVQGVLRAVPLLAGAGFAVAAGQPGAALTMMFAAESNAAKEGYLAKGATEDSAESASNVYGFVATGIEFLSVGHGLKLLGNLRTVILNRSAQKLAIASVGKSITKQMATTAVLQSVEEVGQGRWQDIVGLTMLDQPIEGGWRGMLDRSAQEATIATALTLATGGLGITAGKVGQITEAHTNKFNKALQAKQEDIQTALVNGDAQQADKLINEAVQEATGIDPTKPLPKAEIEFTAEEEAAQAELEAGIEAPGEPAKPSEAKPPPLAGEKEIAAQVKAEPTPAVRKIRSAAFQLPDRSVIEGTSHPTIVLQSKDKGIEIPETAIAGFVTAEGKFVTREEAADIVGRKTPLEARELGPFGRGPERIVVQPPIEEPTPAVRKEEIPTPEQAFDQVKTQISQSIGAARAGFESFDPAMKRAQKRAVEGDENIFLVQRAGGKWVAQDKIPATGHYTIVRPDGTAEFIKQASLTAEESEDFAEKLKGPKITDKAEAIKTKFIERLDNAEALKKELKAFINSSLPASPEKIQALGILDKISAKKWDKINVKNFGEALAFVDFAAESLRKQQAVTDYKKTLKDLKKKFGTKKTLLGEMRPEFAEKVSGLIDGIDVAKLGSRKESDLKGLQHKIQGLATALSQENLIQVDPDLPDASVRELLKIPDARLAQLARLGKTPLTDMTAGEIESINDELARLVGQNNLKNKLITARGVEELSTALEDTQEEMIPSKAVRKGKEPIQAGPVGRLVKLAGSSVATSIQSTTGSLQNTTSKFLMWDIMDGLGKRYDMQRRTKEFTQNRMNEKGISFEDVKTWRKTTHTFEKVTNRHTGKPITLNEDQILSILMDVRNPDNRAAAQRGYNWTEKTLAGVKKQFDTGSLTLQQLGDILKPMTAKHRAMADIANEVLDTKTKPELSDTSMKLFNHDMFRVDNYWAMNRVLPLSLGGARADIQALSNMGMSKERIGGSQPLKLIPFFNKLHNSIEESSAYAHMMVPLFNAKSIMASKDWQDSMVAAGRQDEMKQIIAKFEVLEKSAHSQDALAQWSGALTRGYGRSVLALNVGSIAAQVTSGPLLIAVDPVQYVKHPLLPSSKTLQDEINAHNGVLWKRRNSGQSTKDIGDIRATHAVNEFFFDKSGILNTPMKLQAATDNMVIQKVWRMAKGHVASKTQLTPSSGQRYWDAVNRRTYELMLTQPNWEPFLRSQLLTSPDVLTRGLMAFRSPVEALHNTLLRADADVANELPGARKRQLLAYGAAATSLIAYRAVKTAYIEGRKALPKLAGKDDEKDKGDGILSDAGEKLLYDFFSVSPIGRTAGVVIVNRIVAGVKKERPGRGVIERIPIASVAETTERLASNIGNMIGRKAEGDPKWDEKMPDTIELAVRLAGHLAGLPVNAPLSVAKPVLEPEKNKLQDKLEDINVFEINKKIEQGLKGVRR